MTYPTFFNNKIANTLKQRARKLQRKHLVRLAALLIMGVLNLTAPLFLFNAYATTSVTSVAPTSPTRICNQPILNSPYSYNDAPGTFTTSGTLAGLPTFGAAGTDFPSATSVVVIPAGDNTTAAVSGAYEGNNTIYYFEPGTHIFTNITYTGHNSVYIGGYTSGAGKAIIDGSNGIVPTFGTSKPSSGNNVHNTWEYLTVQNFGSSEDNAVMGNVNGGASDIGDTYKYNTIGPNEYGYNGATPRQGQSSGGGYAINFSDNTTIQYNCLDHNAQGGFNGGGVDANISNNEISYNGLGEYPDTAGDGASPFSCGCSGGGKMNFGTNATVDNNYVHDNYNAGIWLDFDNTGAEISNNYIESNWGEGIFYEANYNAHITYNTLVGNGWASHGAWPAGTGGQACYGGVSCTNGKGPVTGGGGGFPYGAIYLPNTGGNTNITATHDEAGNSYASRFSGEILVQGNVLTNNFGGVVVYTDSDRYPDGINNNSACSTPLSGGSSTYYRQTKYLQANANISGSTVTSAGGATTLCSGYDTGSQDNGHQEEIQKTPSVGMGVYNMGTGTFLGNIASATSPNSFTLDRSPGNATGAPLLISAYGGCGPADYFGGGLGVSSGNPSAAYWDNCIWGSRNVKVTGNTFNMQANSVTGCTAGNNCGYMMAAAFLPGVPTLVQYWSSYVNLIGKASGGLGNVWSSNTYGWTGGGPGAWQFMAGQQGNTISQATWQASPLGQDVGSTFSNSVITPPTYSPSDINQDGHVNLLDLSILASNYGKSGGAITNTRADINGDGKVDLFDLSALANQYGT